MSGRPSYPTPKAPRFVHRQQQETDHSRDQQNNDQRALNTTERPPRRLSAGLGQPPRRSTVPPHVHVEAMGGVRGRCRFATEGRRRRWHGFIVGDGPHERNQQHQLDPASPASATPAGPVVVRATEHKADRPCCAAESNSGGVWTWRRWRSRRPASHHRHRANRATGAAARSRPAAAGSTATSVDVPPASGLTSGSIGRAPSRPDGHDVEQDRFDGRAAEGADDRGFVEQARSPAGLDVDESRSTRRHWRRTAPDRTWPAWPGPAAFGPVRGPPADVRCHRAEDLAALPSSWRCRRSRARSTILTSSPTHRMAEPIAAQANH